MSPGSLARDRQVCNRPGASALHGGPCPWTLRGWRKAVSLPGGCAVAQGQPPENLCVKFNAVLSCLKCFLVFELEPTFLHFRSEWGPPLA